MSAQQIAQAMLDQYGFFVVCYAYPVEVGLVSTKRICAYPLRGKEFVAKVVLVAEASDEDFANQCKIAGLDPSRQPDCHRYRAVAE